MLTLLADIKRTKISHLYLQLGHIHMEADNIHALIEKHKKLPMLLSKFHESE